MSKLVLIDGNAILHRAYHALPPLTTKKGELINAVYGFISMFLKVVVDLEPTHIVVAFDRKEPTFRHKEYKKYQAHRPEMDKGLRTQLTKARGVMKTFKVPVYTKAGFEADDVIGTIAKQASGESSQDEVVIVTGDKDIFQLVTRRVKMYVPTRGMSEAELVGEEAVLERLGVRTDQVVDYKALCGDPSDNYPGVAGIGPKTAKVLLDEYKDVDDIYKNLDKIPENIAKKLNQGKDSARISRKLAKIVTNVPVKYEKDKASRWEIDSKEVIDLFSEYGFKTLTKRAKKVGEDIAKRKQMMLV